MKQQRFQIKEVFHSTRDSNRYFLEHVCGDFYSAYNSTNRNRNSEKRINSKLKLGCVSLIHSVDEKRLTISVIQREML